MRREVNSMAAEREKKTRKRKEKKPPTFYYFIRINDAEPVPLDSNTLKGIFK